MKKFLLTAAAIVSMQAAFAQNSAVTSAIMFQQKGTLDKAKVEIDKAVVHDKTMNSSKAWYYKGAIYQDMATSPVYSKNVNPSEVSREALKAYIKVAELEKDAKKKEFTALAASRLELLQDNLYAFALNEGVELYNDNKFAEAKKAYLEAIKYKPEDTTAYLYGAYAAAGAEDFAGAKELYMHLVNKKVASQAVFSQLLYITSEVDKNEKEAMEIVKMARAAYPNDKGFMLQELNFLIKEGKEDEIMVKLNAALKADPTNANLYSVRGNMYERLKKQDEAIADYTKAIELEPSSFDAQYNMGVYYFNKGVNILKKTEKMKLAEYNKVGKAQETEAKKLFSQALPYFEAALKAQPQDRTTIQSLNRVYNSLGRTADAKRMDALLQQL